MKILVSCLEPSANLHFGYVLDELKKLKNPNEKLEIVGIFDDRYGSPFIPSKEFSAMGFVEIIPLILKAKKAINDMVKLARDCDKVLLIDSPAFNLPLAKKLKKSDIKATITYYILPQVWAWKRKRVEIVQKYCDNLASIWPFEKDFYSKSTYVGNPLLDEVNLSYNPHPKTIAFLPGSRVSEIKRLMPIFRETVKEFKDFTNIVAIPKIYENDLEKINSIYGDLSQFKISFDALDVLSKSEFAFICSGTATLQAALISTPFVLCYKAKAIDIFIAKKFVKLKHVGLANIILDFMNKPPLHKELIQEEVGKESLLRAYKDCDRDKFALACKELKEYLSNGSALNVAKLILSKNNL